MEFAKQFKAARRVSTPLLAVRTFDAASTIKNVCKNVLGSKRNETPIFIWDAIRGLKPFTPKAETVLTEMPTLDGSQVFPVMLEAIAHFQKDTDAIVFVSNAHLFWNLDPSHIQAIWNLRDSFKADGNMLVLLCSPGSVLPPELTNDILVLDEPLPTEEQLSEIIGDIFKYAKVSNPDAETVSKATQALIGLPSFPADQSVAMCLDSKTGKLDIAELWDRKRQIVNQTSGLTIWQGSETLEDIGGLDNAKEFFCRYFDGAEPPNCIIFIDEIEKAFAGTGTDMSGVKTELTGSFLSWTEDKKVQGVLSIGVPGVGKSQLPKALGNKYGKPVIKTDIAGMQSGIVGSSGANLRQALKVIDAISAGKVLMIATCNGIQSLPPELQSRFKLGTFFFDAPDSEERRAIWKIYRAKYNVPETDQTPNDSGWTGREIEACCHKAYLLKMTLAEASRFVVPVTRSSADIIKALRQSASGRYISASKPGFYSYSELQTEVTVLSEQIGRKIRSEKLDS